MDTFNVLLIDDEEAFVTTLQERLDLRGINARVALNGRDGLDMIAAELPDAVVLDLRMPGMSGTEVLQQIRRNWPELPVIMLSGHGSEQDFEACRLLGARDYHKKPLELEVLLESLTTVIRERGKG